MKMSKPEMPEGRIPPPPIPPPWPKDYEASTVTSEGFSKTPIVFKTVLPTIGVLLLVWIGINFIDVTETDRRETLMSESYRIERKLIAKEMIYSMAQNKISVDVWFDDGEDTVRWVLRGDTDIEGTGWTTLLREIGLRTWAD